LNVYFDDLTYFFRRTFRILDFLFKNWTYLSKIKWFLSRFERIIKKFVALLDVEHNCQELNELFKLVAIASMDWYRRLSIFVDYKHTFFIINKLPKQFPPFSRCLAQFRLNSSLYPAIKLTMPKSLGNYFITKTIFVIINVVLSLYTHRQFNKIQCFVVRPHHN
jgi:hypothetical protein